MTQQDTLIARLRAMGNDETLRLWGGELRAVLLLEAAARIEALEAEVAKLSKDAPSEIQIGGFVLRRHSSEHIWLGLLGGEGGSFLVADVERVLAAFYRENF